jgi:hypothetical protein
LAHPPRPSHSRSCSGPRGFPPSGSPHAQSIRVIRSRAWLPFGDCRFRAERHPKTSFISAHDVTRPKAFHVATPAHHSSLSGPSPEVQRPSDAFGTPSPFCDYIEPKPVVVGRKLASLPTFPPSGFLTLLAVFSSVYLASLFHLASTHGVLGAQRTSELVVAVWPEGHRHATVAEHRGAPLMLRALRQASCTPVFPQLYPPLCRRAAHHRYRPTVSTSPPASCSEERLAEGERGWHLPKRMPRRLSRSVGTFSSGRSRHSLGVSGRHSRFRLPEGVGTGHARHTEVWSSSFRRSYRGCLHLSKHRSVSSELANPPVRSRGALPNCLSSTNPEGSIR